MTWTLAAAVLARAGGGQNFHPSGGGGGGGGGSFGGGGGGGFFFLPFFLGGGGLIGLLLVIFFIYLISRAASGSSRSSGGYASGSGPVPIAPPPLPYDDTHPVGVPDSFRGQTLPGTHETAIGNGVADGLAAIRAHDPGFDEAAFLSQVERAFFVIEQAWSELKPEMSRQVMGESLWEQHRAQIEQYRASGRRNALDNLSVGRAEITSAHSDTSYDTVSVRLLAACADYDVDVSNGHIVRGDRDVRQFTEDWIFQRSSQATTKENGGTLSKRCPNCGAPLDVDLAGVCSYCKASVMSGAYDWVLTRIDQVGVY